MFKRGKNQLSLGAGFQLLFKPVVRIGFGERRIKCERIKVIQRKVRPIQIRCRRKLMNTVRQRDRDDPIITVFPAKPLKRPAHIFAGSRSKGLFFPVQGYGLMKELDRHGDERTQKHTPRRKS